MSPSVQIVLLWLAFGASHVALSSRRLRPRIVARTGERGFLGLYSVVAFAFFVPLVSVYLGNRHGGGWLWTVPMTPVVTWTVYAVMTVGVLLIVAGLVSPSPTSLAAGRGAVEVKAVHRLTRHPLFMGFGWIGVVHLVPNASLNDVLFFAGLPVFAVVGCLHQERRLRATRGPEFAAYVDATPFLPFTGSQTLRGLREIPLWLYALAIATSATLRWLHTPLFH